VSKADALRIKARLGLRIVELRTLRELTQEQLAELVRLERRQMQRVEAGDANLKLETLILFAAALRCEFSELFRAPARSTRRKPGRPPSRASADPKARAPRRR
jgi:transcriptional regulator with XRE-family HTH domain